MKNTGWKTNKKGFTLIELMAAMIIIAVILGAVLAAVQGATNTSRVTSTLASIRALQTASTNYYNSNGGNYTGGTLGTISLTNLASNNMLPANTSGTNAWNGSISVAPDTNANYFDITLTNVPANAGNTTNGTLTTAVANLTQTAPTYAAKTETWEAAF